MSRPYDGPVRGALYALLPALAGWAVLIGLAVLIVRATAPVLWALAAVGCVVVFAGSFLIAAVAGERRAGDRWWDR